MADITIIKTQIIGGIHDKCTLIIYILYGLWRTIKSIRMTFCDKIR